MYVCMYGLKLNLQTNTENIDREFKSKFVSFPFPA